MIRLFGREGGPVQPRPHYSPEMQKKMRRVFSGEEGEEVLTFLITDLGFLDGTYRTDEKTGRREILTGEEAVRATALRDYARRLLEMLGILDERNVFELTKKMMQLPVWEPKNTQ